MRSVVNLNWQHGNTRTVLLLPSLGIVLKIANINLVGFFLDLRPVFLGQVSPKLLLRPWQLDPEVFSGFASRIFGGIWANLLEFWFYWRYRHKVLAPTYLSLGLFNIQKIGRVLPKDELTGMWGRFMKAFGQKSFYLFGSHLFDHEGNIGEIHGQGKCLLDYGSRRIKAVMKKRDEVWELLNA